MRSAIACVAVALILSYGAVAQAQSSHLSDGRFAWGTDVSSSVSPVSQADRASQSRSGSGGGVGLAVRASTLGLGIEAGVPIASRLNVRGGFNVFTYSESFSDEGIDYNADLKLQSGDIYLDVFPFGGGFHISPGLLFNANTVTGRATVPLGEDISLGDGTYINSATNPLGGSVDVDFQRVAPAVMLGWGNIVPRGSRHWSIPFEFGVVFQGAPRAMLNLTGSVCDITGNNCRTIASDPTVQANIRAQQAEINDTLSPFKYYPVISIGFSYRFGG